MTITPDQKCTLQIKFITPPPPPLMASNLDLLKMDNVDFRENSEKLHLQPREYTQNVQIRTGAKELREHF